MGIKRPLEEENFLEPSFKQLKQLDCSINQPLNTEEPQITSWEADSAGERKSNVHEFQFYGQLEDGDADKELEASAPLSLVTSSSSEEDVGDGNTSSSLPYLPGYIDSNGPRRAPKQFEDPYIYLLNCSPRKEVPIGPDYQAVIPPWDPNGSDYIADHNWEQKVMGTCIIPMPKVDDSTIDGVKVGRGRNDCSCPDKVSVRCIQQHVKEAREKLRETIGDEHFTELGFCDIGDEVGCKWTPDEEQAFHEIVFSNPVSQGRNFWKALGAAFPTRTKRELVSYYFNVFMLHKRAIQNRSYVLEIDSDDDEEPKVVSNGDLYQNQSYYLETDSDDDEEPQPARGDFYPNETCTLVPNIDDPQGLVGDFCLAGDEDDSTVESLDDQDLDASWVDEFWSDPENNEGDKGSNN